MEGDATAAARIESLEVVGPALSKGKNVSSNLRSFDLL
jgi:hypothetical protein